jgi:MFS family permease
LVWGAILAVSLQSRSLELAPAFGVRAYATIAAVGALVATLVQLGAGAVADRRLARIGNRSEFYLAGLALAVPALIWFFFAPDLLQFMTAFFLLQFGMNVATGPYQAAIADYIAPERRGVASSWMSAYQSLGNVLGLLVAGFVHDVRLVVLALAAPLVATCAVTLAALRGRTVLSQASASASAAPASAVTASGANVSDASASGAGARAPGLRLRGPLGTLLISRGLINVGFFTLLGFLLFFVRDSLGVQGADAVKTQTALLFISFTVAAIAGAIAAARPTDRYDKRAVVSVAVAVIVLALALLAMAPNLGVAYAAAVLAGAAWGAFVTADWALASAVLPGGAMATAMGIWNVATTVPQILAPLLTAPLVERASALSPGLGPRLAVALSLLEFAAGAIFIWRLPRA